MSNISIFKQDLPDFLQKKGISELTKSLMKGGGSGTKIKRISSKNGIFRKNVDGAEVGKLKGNLKVVVVNAAPDVSRVFYAKTWSADGEVTAPDCSSANGKTPDAGVANPQGTSCATCPMNVSGSGQGTTKACRYSQRMAVILADEIGTNVEGEVYQMNLASKSIFGKGDNGEYPFLAYASFIGNNGRNIEDMITEISFNEDNDNQSLLFKAVGYVDNQEFADIVSKAMGSPEAKLAVKVTVAQADGVVKLPAPATKAKVVEADEEFEEPVKRPSKKAEVTAAPKKDLASVVDDWGSDD